jgi:hypothetical protein
MKVYNCKQIFLLQIVFISKKSKSAMLPSMSQLIISMEKRVVQIVHDNMNGGGQ